MASLRILALVVSAAVLAASGAGAQTPRTAAAPHTTIELLSASASLETRADTWIGVRFVLEPGWHLYWQNPGNSGMPPMLLWSAPPGATVGDVEWPAPERIPLGAFVNYGYHGEVVFPVRLRAATGMTGTLALNASWVVCKDVCVQGKARVGLTYPMTGTAAAATGEWAARLAEARRRIPAPLPTGWRATAAVSPTGFDIDIVAPSTLNEPLFFSIDEGVIDEAAAPVVSRNARGVRLSLTRSDLLSATPSALRGVLTTGGGTSYELVMRLRSPRPPQGRPR